MSSDLIDMKTLTYEYGDDWDIFEELIADYQSSYQEMLTSLEQAIEDKDSEGLRMKAHTIKGIVANFYSDKLRDEASKLEACGKNEDFTQASDYLNNFKKLNDEVLSLIHDYSMSKVKAC
jgi:HPt (histidine-containing phosphotransfer) domain-containing protein